jgi:hypothetical protein
MDLKKDVRTLEINPLYRLKILIHYVELGAEMCILHLTGRIGHTPASNCRMLMRFDFFAKLQENDKR